MAQNRSILFGYQMTKGGILPHPQEKTIVEEIYQQYITGLSYKFIAEELTQRKIPYLPKKNTWNKNMVARILQNEHYIGSDKYPPLLDVDIFLAAQSAIKPYKKTVPPEIKQLKPLVFCGVCGAEMERKWIVSNKERWKCCKDVNHIGIHFSDKGLLEQLLKLREENRNISGTQFKSKQIDMETIHLEKNLKENKELSPIEKKKMLYQIAQMKYNSCQYIEVAHSESLDKWLNNIEKICVIECSVTEIHLKNGNIIRKE